MQTSSRARIKLYADRKIEGLASAWDIPRGRHGKILPLLVHRQGRERGGGLGAGRKWANGEDRERESVWPYIRGDSCSWRRRRWGSSKRPGDGRRCCTGSSASSPPRCPLIKYEIGDINWVRPFASAGPRLLGLNISVSRNENLKCRCEVESFAELLLRLVWWDLVSVGWERM